MKQDDFDRVIIEALRKEWHETIKGKGGHCPCCDRWGKVNTFKLTEALAASLMWMHKFGDVYGVIDVQNKAPRWILKSKNYPLLKHWGLIESKNQRDGIWQVTPKGRNFIFGNLTVPDRVFIYNNEVFGFAEKETNYRGCLGVKFSYDEIFSSQFAWEKVKLKKEQNG